MSQASLTRLSSQAGNTVVFDSRRFRPNFVLHGCEPHEEDGWLGGVIQVGSELRLHILGRDPRCVITTLDPNTGQRDVDTLGYILGVLTLWLLISVCMASSSTPAQSRLVM